MSRYTDTLTAGVQKILGNKFTVYTNDNWRGRLLVEHCEGASDMIYADGDGRKNATEKDVTDSVTNYYRKVRQNYSNPNYTDKARAQYRYALLDMSHIADTLLTSQV